MVNKRIVVITGAITAAALAVGGSVAAVSMSSGPGAVQHPKAIVKTLRWVPTRGGASLSVVSARKDAKRAHRAQDPTDYVGYVAAAGGYAVDEVDVSTDTIIGSISDDTGEGVAVTPSDSTVYIADTGQYYVLAYNVSTKKTTDIEVGPYPQDVAVSPDGSEVYATVTGGDTGSGGSDVLAIISTATNAVTADIHIGTAPRQVVFSPDGSYAYVTTQDGIYVINVATSQVIQVFHEPFSTPFGSQSSGATGLGPQGIAVSADGKTLYVTEPVSNQVWELSASSGTVQGVTTVGDQPYAVTAAGTSLYVANMNDDTVSVVSTMSGKVTDTIDVGRLPMSIATTPDGSQVWVGNGLSGSVSVISVTSGDVVATIGGGPGTSTLDAATLGFAFAQAPSS
jgi:YVTN family beta-propeller protein